MPFLSNSHTHSTYCDGKSPIDDTLAAAARFGFVSLGFSGHIWQGVYDGCCMKPDEQKAYLNELRSKKDLPFKLWVGLELDALIPEDVLQDALNTTDYVIGSTHYLTMSPKPVAVDGTPEPLKEYTLAKHHGCGLATAEEYFELHKNFLLRVHPQIIGHFDLIRKNAAKAALFDENDPDYRRMALKALEESFPCGGILEVNTGGMARGYMSSPYPTPELLNAWREMGGKVTITSDCHQAENLMFAYPMAEDMIREAGFRSVWRLGTGSELFEEIELD